MDDWDRCLAPANFACANAKSALTGYIPFLPELRHPRVPAAVMQRGSAHTSVPSAENFVERMDALLVDDLSHAAQQRQKFYADRVALMADLKLADAYFFVPSGSQSWSAHTLPPIRGSIHCPGQGWRGCLSAGSAGRYVAHASGSPR